MLWLVFNGIYFYAFMHTYAKSENPVIFLYIRMIVALVLPFVLFGDVYFRFKDYHTKMIRNKYDELNV